MEMIWEGPAYGGGIKTEEISRAEFEKMKFEGTVDPDKSYLIVGEPENDYKFKLTSDGITIRNDDTHSITTSFVNPNINDVSDMKAELEKLKENMNRQLNVTMMHGCRNCGAQLEMDINKPVIHCKHCGTAYVIGTIQTNSRY